MTQLAERVRPYKLPAGVVALTALSALVCLGVRAAILSEYQTSSSTTFASANPALIQLAQTIPAQPETLNDTATRAQLSAIASRASETLDPLGSMPAVRNTFLGSEHRTDKTLATNLGDDLDALAQMSSAGAPPPLLAFRLDRVMRDAARLPGTDDALRSAEPQAHRLWVKAYFVDMSRGDKAFDGAVRDPVAWLRANPAGSGGPDWFGRLDHEASVAGTNADLALQDMRGLPIPDEALQPAQEYASAAGRAAPALSALTDYANSNGSDLDRLTSAETGLADYQHAHDAAMDALRFAAHTAGAEL